MMLIAKLTKGFTFEDYSNYISNSHAETSGIIFEKNSSKVTIKYSREEVEKAKSIGNKWHFIEDIRVPLIACEMIINNATDLEINDPDKLSLFSICKIEYDDSVSQIIITSNIPLKLVINVTKVDLGFYESSMEIGYQEKRIYFGKLEFERAQGNIIYPDLTE